MCSLRKVVAILTLCISALGAVRVSAQTSVLSCVQVESNGDATLSWSVPPLWTLPFDSLRWNFSNNPGGQWLHGPLVLSGLQTTATVALPLPDALSQPFFFYGEVYVGGLSTPVITDTIASMFLQVSNATEGFANLTWNAPRIPLLASASPTYSVYRKYDTAPNSGWALAGITGATSFTDSVVQCDDSITYRIDLNDALPCVSKSNEVKKFFVNAKPDTPSIQFVSVDQITGKAYVTWSPAQAGDVTGYSVYFIQNGTPTTVGTLSGSGSTFFSYPASTAWNGSEEFRVASIDSCNKVSNPGVTHRSLFLQHDFDLCGYKATLYWNAYENWPGGVAQYTLYASQGGGGFQPVANLGPNQTAFTYSIAPQAATYRFYVQAKDASGLKVSQSNVDTLIARVPRQPGFLYLRYATVDSDSIIRLSFLHDTLASVIAYRIERSDNKGRTWESIGRVPFRVDTALLYYSDSTVFADEQSYEYRIAAIDSCGNSSVLSQVCRSLWLRGLANLNYNNQIYWNPYQGFSGGVQYYRVYRAERKTFAGEVRGNLASTEGIFVDQLADSLFENGRYCYRVVAYEGVNTQYFFTDSASSNMICLQAKPRIFIPNAFSPQGDKLNEVWKPHAVFIAPEDYLLQLFDRWGRLIFRTTMPNDGWDGKEIDGSDMPEGVYAFTIQFRGQDGELDYRRGTVTLIR
jgi:gliding motility-associated-like protein